MIDQYAGLPISLDPTTGELDFHDGLLCDGFSFKKVGQMSGLYADMNTVDPEEPVTAPMSARATLFMKEKGGSLEEAVRRIEHIENRRASYYNYYTGKKWGCAASYDLCVDSSLLGTEETAKLVAEFIHKRFER